MKEKPIYRIKRKLYATGRSHFWAEYYQKSLLKWEPLSCAGYCTQAEAAEAIKQHKDQFVFKEDIVWTE